MRPPLGVGGALVATSGLTEAFMGAVYGNLPRRRFVDEVVSDGIGDSGNRCEVPEKLFTLGRAGIRGSSDVL